MDAPTPKSGPRSFHRVQVRREPDVLFCSLELVADVGRGVEENIFKKITKKRGDNGKGTEASGGDGKSGG